MASEKQVSSSLSSSVLKEVKKPRPGATQEQRKHNHLPQQHIRKARSHLEVLLTES